MAEDDLVDIEAGAGADGVKGKLRVTQRAADVIAKLFPTKAARLSATRVFSTGILQKLASGEPLDDTELEYADAVFGEAEAKYARRKAVAERAVAALESGAVLALPAPQVEDGQPKAERRAPEEDWLNRFWADAELVSDEVMQEIYGRILASEARKPGTCSRLTLDVLRRLDRRIADLFARVLDIQLSGIVPNSKALLKAAGVSFGDLLKLDEVGLLVHRDSIGLTIPTDERTQKFWADYIVAINGGSGIHLSGYPLSQAGLEIGRIAQIAHRADAEQFECIINWLRRCARKSGCTVEWAQRPSPEWVGFSAELTWVQIVPAKNSGEAPP